jgi:hypothetical protein
MDFAHNRNRILLSALAGGSAVALLVVALAFWPSTDSMAISDNNSDGSSEGMESTNSQPATPIASTEVEFIKKIAAIHNVMLDCSDIPQQAYRNSTLPLSVRMFDSGYDNRPITGETISWIIMPMGHIVSSTAISDANGLVQDSLSLSAYPVGIYKIQAHFGGSPQYPERASCEAQVLVLGQMTAAPIVKTDIEDIDANVDSNIPTNTTTVNTNTTAGNANSTNDESGSIHQSHGGSGSNNNCDDTSIPSVSIGSIVQQPMIKEDSSTIDSVLLEMAGTASDSATSCEEGLKEVKTAVLNYNTNEVIQWYGSTTENSQGWNSQSTVYEDGQYRVVARAIDETGKKKWTSEVTDVNFGLQSIRSHITIDSPTYGDTLTGPSSAAVVEVSGTTSYTTQRIIKVEVRVDENAYQLATPIAEDDWSSWTTNLTIDTDGMHSILAKSTDNSGHTLWAFINVGVEFHNEA